MGEKKVRVLLTKPQQLGAGVTAIAGGVLEVPEMLANILLEKQVAMLLGRERLSRVLETPNKMAYTEKPKRVTRLCRVRG